MNKNNKFIFIFFIYTYTHLCFFLFFLFFSIFLFFYFFGLGPTQPIWAGWAGPSQPRPATGLGQWPGWAKQARSTHGMAPRVIYLRTVQHYIQNECTKNRKQKMAYLFSGDGGDSDSAVVPLVCLRPFPLLLFASVPVCFILSAALEMMMKVPAFCYWFGCFFFVQGCLQR